MISHRERVFNQYFMRRDGFWGIEKMAHVRTFDLWFQHLRNLVASVSQAGAPYLAKLVCNSNVTMVLW